MAKDLVKLLKTLQQEVRSKGRLEARGGRGGKIPQRLATPEAGWLEVGPGIAHLIREVTEALREDERFEHLAEKADATVWEFVCDSAINRGTDHVKAFVNDRSRAPQSFTLRFSVDHLTVAEPEPVGDVVLLPLPDESTKAGQHLRRDAAAGCMAQVVVTGTDSRRATERGRERARHALSLLRVSLANIRGLHERQLRFRVGEMFTIDESLQGFQRHDDEALDIDLDKPLGEAIPGFKPLELPFTTGTEIHRRLALAVSWIDAAHMDASPIHRVGFLFTALEAMLGDSAEGLKAPALVFYRTALGHVVQGQFPDPHRLYYLYDQVRSYATHGEITPDVTEDDIAYLNWNIRTTLFDLVTLCQTRNLVSRAQVRKELMKDGVDQLTLDYLRSTGPQDWWADWSPGPKKSKGEREQELASEVEALTAELAELKERFAALEAHSSGEEPTAV